MATKKTFVLLATSRKLYGVKTKGIRFAGIKEVIFEIPIEQAQIEELLWPPT